MVEEWDVISNGQEHVSKETILSFTIQAIESALPEDMEPAPSRSRSQVSRTLAQHLLQSPRWIDLKHIQRYTFTEYVEFALRPLLHDLKNNSVLVYLSIFFVLTGHNDTTLVHFLFVIDAFQECTSLYNCYPFMTNKIHKRANTQNIHLNCKIVRYLIAQ